MQIKFTHTVPMVSNDIRFLPGCTYKVAEVEAKRLITTFGGYFVDETPVVKPKTKPKTPTKVTDKE